MLNAKAAPAAEHKGAGYLVDIVLRAVALAMGVAVTVLAVLDEADMNSTASMLGIGLASLGIYSLKN